MENLIISVHAILPMFLVMALGYGVSAGSAGRRS